MADRRHADITRLCTLLQEACSRFKALGGQSIWSRYASGPDIASQLLAWIPKIRSASLSDQEALALWQIFAPTCDCDDVLGDADFCESVFESIVRLYPLKPS